MATTRLSLGIRFFLLLTGVYCLWWSYDVYTDPNACEYAVKISQRLVRGACHLFSNRVASLLPALFGFTTFGLAFWPGKK